MTKFHSDDYIKFLRSIRPDNMSEYNKQMQRCKFCFCLKSHMYDSSCISHRNCNVFEILYYIYPNRNEKSKRLLCAQMPLEYIYSMHVVWLLKMIL